jgi:hypothetical protein
MGELPMHFNDFTQSLSSSQPSPEPQAGQAPPPQSTSVSSGSRTPLKQTGLVWSGVQKLPVQTPLKQSSWTWQFHPTLHFVGHEPPQSTSVSEPSFAVLWHGETHTALTQKVLAQSEPTPHFLSSAHFFVHEPPQSVSVSEPSVVVLLHGETHTPLLQEVLAQSVPAPHFMSSAHAFGHEPPQSTSASPPLATWSSQLGIVQTLPVHPAFVQVLHTPLRQSLSCTHIWSSAHLLLHDPPQSMSVSSPLVMPSVHCGTISLTAHEPLTTAAGMMTNKTKAPAVRYPRNIGRFSFEERFTMAAKVTR